MENYVFLSRDPVAIPQYNMKAHYRDEEAVVYHYVKLSTDKQLYITKFTEDERDVIICVANRSVDTNNPVITTFKQTDDKPQYYIVEKLSDNLFYGRHFSLFSKYYYYTMLKKSIICISYGRTYYETRNICEIVDRNINLTRVKDVENVNAYLYNEYKTLLKQIFAVIPANRLLLAANALRIKMESNVPTTDVINASIVEYNREIGYKSFRYYSVENYLTGFFSTLQLWEECPNYECQPERDFIIVERGVSGSGVNVGVTSGSSGASVDSSVLGSGVNVGMSSVADGSNVAVVDSSGGVSDGVKNNNLMRVELSIPAKMSSGMLLTYIRNAELAINYYDNWAFTDDTNHTNATLIKSRSYYYRVENDNTYYMNYAVGSNVDLDEC